MWFSHSSTGWPLLALLCCHNYSLPLHPVLQVCHHSPTQLLRGFKFGSRVSWLCLASLQSSRILPRYLWPSHAFSCICWISCPSVCNPWSYFPPKLICGIHSICTFFVPVVLPLVIHLRGGWLYQLSDWQLCVQTWHSASCWTVMGEQKVYYFYSSRSGSGPPWLVGH